MQKIFWHFSDSKIDAILRSISLTFPSIAFRINLHHNCQKLATGRLSYTIMVIPVAFHLKILTFSEDCYIFQIKDEPVEHFFFKFFRYQLETLDTFITYC